MPVRAFVHGIEFFVLEGLHEMRLRRVFSVFVSLVLVLAALPPTVALAAADVSIVSTSVNPTTLSGAGEVTLSVGVKVADNSADKATGVYVARDGDRLSDVYDIDAGDEQTISCTLPVSEDDLGHSISLQLLWDGGGSLSFSVKVEGEEAAEPEVSFSRSFSQSSAAKGSEVTISYKISNTGSVPITDLVVTDEKAGDVSLTYSKLSAGKSKTLTYKHTMDSDLTSEPKLTYEANGKTYTKSLSAKTVSLSTADMDVVLEASQSEVASGGEITLSCSITNTGNLNLKSITVSDDTLGSDLFTTSSLKTGIRKEFTKSVTLTETTKFRFVVTAKDSDGNTYTFRSNSETVKISGAEETAPAADYDLEILASSDTLQLTQAGDVNFTITVNNKSDASVADVKIVDQDGVVIKEFDILPVGENPFVYRASVTQTTDFNFYAVVEGENGEYRVASGPVEITVTDGAASASPTASIEPSPSATQVTGGSNGSLGSLMVALLIVGFLIVITVIVLVVMILKDKRQREQPARRR